MDGFADQIADNVSSELNKVAPLHKCIRRSPKRITKWLSSEAIEQKRQRRRLEKRWISSKCEADRVAYRWSCRSANRPINNSRCDYFRSKFNDCSNSGQQWRVAKELLHTSEDGRTHGEVGRQTLCSTFSSFFQSKINSIKLAISAKTALLPVFSPTLDLPFTGTPLTSFSIVTYA